MAGRTDSRLSVDRGGDERAGFRSDGSAAVGARPFILCHRIWRAQRRSQHEGVTAAPAIDLFAFQFPLSRADQRNLTCLLGAVPALLEQAKVNLRKSNARDLWVYGAGTLRNQSEVLGKLQAGTLDMRTLEGSRHANLAGAGRALLIALEH